MSGGTDPRKIKFLITGLLVAGAMVALFAVSLNQPGAAYYISVTDFKRGQAHGDNFRINGKVQPDSIRRQPGGMDLSFTMTDGTSLLPVRYHGVVPDTFAAKADVVVEGELGADGVFAAHTLLAKCPSKYEAAAQARPPAGGG